MTIMSAASLLRLRLRLSTIRTDSIQVIRTGLGSIVINALFGLGSILITRWSDAHDGADVGDVRVAVFFFFFSFLIFEAWEAFSVVAS